MKKWLVVLILLLLTACTDDEPAIVKTESAPEDPGGEPELVEQVDEKDDETEKFIEFPLPDEQIRINLKKVPILDSYLHASSDMQKAIERMKIERIPLDSARIYLLEFSCENELCSYLLFNRDVTDATYLLADLAKSVAMLPSPDQTKMLFLFDRKGSLPRPLSTIIVIDLENWEHLSLKNETSGEMVLNFTWPLSSVNWIDNETISAEKPAIPEPTDEGIQEWHNTNDSLVTNILFHVLADN